MKTKVIIALIIILPMLTYGIKQFSEKQTSATAKENTPQINQSTPYAKQNSNKITEITVYKFYSPLCKDCIIQAKEVEKIKPALNKKVIFKEINVSEKNSKNEKMIEEYRIMAVPTMIITDSNGIVQRKFTQIISGEELIEEIDKILKEK